MAEVFRVLKLISHDTHFLVESIAAVVNEKILERTLLSKQRNVLVSFLPSGMMCPGIEPMTTSHTRSGLCHWPPTWGGAYNPFIKTVVMYMPLKHCKSHVFTDVNNTYPVQGHCRAHTCTSLTKGSNSRLHYGVVIEISAGSDPTFLFWTISAFYSLETDIAHHTRICLDGSALQINKDFGGGGIKTLVSVLHVHVSADWTYR